VGIRDYLTDLTRSGALRGAIGRAFRVRRRGADVPARVLVVVLDTRLRETIVAGLRHKAYHVEAAGNVREALALCRRHDPDVALVDAEVDDRSGAELLSLLRRQRPEIATIALVQGGTSRAHGPVGAAVANVDATLEMPVDTATLLDAVERALGAT
jgi:DNA-binding NtrC family response regulator